MYISKQFSVKNLLKTHLSLLLIESLVEGRRNNIVCVCENSYIFFPKDIQVLRGELITFIKEIETFFWEAEQMPDHYILRTLM